ncbi:MAG: ABC transporter ATP-binding protein [Burkholderiaceae bacterium]|nr:ABC transporter ATP-binding protein [Burkholderiaceae bacterium]
MQFQVKNGYFSYGNHEVLHGIDFTFDCQGVMSILGRNGAGKTTLLKCMLGLQHWTQGQTLINGFDITKIASKKFWSEIGYVPQAKMPSFSYSVQELVVLGRNVHIGNFAQPGRKDWEIVEESLELVGIAHLKNKLCNQISGGEYQLALVARALVSQPKLLILDEPESNLDFKNQLRILKVITKLTQEKKIGAIINTHFPAHALEISSKALLMLPGNRSLFGPTQEILTEKNLTKSFGIDVRILPTHLSERPNYCCVVALDSEK